MNLPSSSGRFNEGRLHATPRLGAPNPGKPGANFKRLEGLFHRLDLRVAMVGIEALCTLLPATPVPRFLPCRRNRRAKHFQVQVKPVGHLIDKAVSLGKHVAGIDDNDRYVGFLRNQHVQHHGRLRAETRAHDMFAGQLLQRPGDSLLRGHGL